MNTYKIELTAEEIQTLRDSLHASYQFNVIGCEDARIERREDDAEYYRQLKARFGSLFNKLSDALGGGCVYRVPEERGGNA